MSQIGMFFGTTTGKTAEAAEKIQEAFGGEDVVTLIEIPDAETGDFSEYSCLLIGCPTWDIGELQSDWDGFMPNLDSIDFSGKKIAYFGTGDPGLFHSKLRDDVLNVLHKYRCHPSLS